MKRWAFVIVLLAAGLAACDGDSTLAAGRCIVAFRAVVQEVEADPHSPLHSLERTLYWCDSAREWGSGFARVDEELVLVSGGEPLEVGELPSPDEFHREFLEFTLGELLCTNCDVQDSPVCRDARKQGIRGDGDLFEID